MEKFKLIIREIEKLNKLLTIYGSILTSIVVIGESIISLNDKEES